MNPKIQRYLFEVLKNCIFLWVALLWVTTPLYAAKKNKFSTKPLPQSSFKNEEGKWIDQVDVDGNKRVEKNAILTKINSKVGSTLNLETIQSDIRALYSMGYFEEIEFISPPGVALQKPNSIRLLVKVKEKPVISKIEFKGNEKLTSEDLKAVIKVKEWSIMDRSKISEDIELLQKHYEDKGYFLTEIKYEVVPLKEDELQLNFLIDDHEKVKIKRISFVNNRVFSDEKLKGVFAETKENGFFSFLSSSGTFKDAAFKVDLQRLTYWYLDNGYLKFKHDPPVVTVSDDKKSMVITIFVDEGQQYTVGEVNFSGDLLFSRTELQAETKLLKNDTFSIIKRNADIQKLSEMYQDLGYAFTNVIPKMDVKDDSKTVDIEYVFEKGQLAYFGKINIVSNTKTYDKVIRRELKINEGDQYHGTKLRESRENVERLGFFAPGEVVFNTLPAKGKNSILDLEIKVKERSTGTIQLGAGYGGNRGLFFQTQVSEQNFLGKGQNLSLSANISRDNREKSINLGFTDPYAFDTDISAGGDAYFTSTFIPRKYSTRKLGFALRLGYPLEEFTRLFLTYKNEGMKIEDVNTADFTVEDYKDIASDEGVLSSLVLSAVRDKRNNRFETSAGNYQSLSLEYAGLGGDKRFYKLMANNRFFYRLVGDLVFRNSIEYGQVVPYGENLVPSAERFYLGGPNNLKGFDFYTVGPQRTRPRTCTRADSTTYDCSETVPVGGNYQFFGLFELEYPIIREAGLKFVTFYDVGNVFPQGLEFKEMKLKQDVGFGFRWFSPIGPLRFEFGYPINPTDGESSSQFQFFIGPPF